MKSLKETFKSGTIEKNKVNQSNTSEVYQSHHNQQENGFTANIYSNKDIERNNFTRTSNKKKNSKMILDKSLTKSRNDKKQSLFQENMNQQEKLAFDLFRQNEPAGMTSNS
jgi:hypothetical protein